MKKKLLFFVDALYGGGAEKIAQTILSEIDFNRYDVTLYSMHQEELNHLYPSDIRYQYIFNRCDSSRSQISQLISKLWNKVKLFVYYHCSARLFYRLFVKGKYNIELAFIEGYATRIVSGSPNKKSRKLAWLHTDLAENHWTEVAYQSMEEEDQIYRAFDQVVAVSESVRSSCSQLFSGISKSRVLHNPIDQHKIKHLALQQILEPLSSKKVFRFISVGRLVPQKGYDRLLPIFRQFLKEQDNIELLILGDGEQREELQEYINQYQLNDYIKLLGFKENPYQYMAYCDAFVASSRTEGYSTVVTEALILGLPVVATNCAGMQELLGTHSEYGLVVDNNENALLEGLRQLMQPKIYENLKIKAKARSSHFKLKYLMQQFEHVLEGK